MTVEEKLIAFVHAMNNYHSGQGSKGYRWLCNTLRILRNKGILYPLDMVLSRDQRRYYTKIVSRFYDSI